MSRKKIENNIISFVLSYFLAIFVVSNTLETRFVYARSSVKAVDAPHTSTFEGNSANKGRQGSEAEKDRAAYRPIGLE